jgi:small neutral amino acid transporter SnatA (MarC family)
VPVDTFFLVKSFVTLIVVIDPVSSVPVFLAMTDRYEPRQRHRAAWQAVLVAALIIAVFVLFGQQSCSTWGLGSRAWRPPVVCCSCGRTRPASRRGRGLSGES